MTLTFKLWLINWLCSYFCQHYVYERLTEAPNYRPDNQVLYYQRNRREILDKNDARRRKFGHLWSKPVYTYETVTHKCIVCGHHFDRNYLRHRRPRSMAEPWVWYCLDCYNPKPKFIPAQFDIPMDIVAPITDPELEAERAFKNLVDKHIPKEEFPDWKAWMSKRAQRQIQNERDHANHLNMMITAAKNYEAAYKLFQ